MTAKRQRRKSNSKKRLGERVHPTLRGEAAKDGAPKLWWWGKGEQATARRLGERVHPTLRGEAAKDGAPKLLWWGKGEKATPKAMELVG
jgi:hypothetical protein